MKGVHDAPRRRRDARRPTGVDAEVIDLRSLRPLDLDDRPRVRAKTNRLLAVEEGPRTAAGPAGCSARWPSAALERPRRRLAADDARHADPVQPAARGRVPAGRRRDRRSVASGRRRRPLTEEELRWEDVRAERRRLGAARRRRPPAPRAPRADQAAARASPSWARCCASTWGTSATSPPPTSAPGRWTSSPASRCCRAAPSRSCGTSARPPATTSSTARGSRAASPAGISTHARRDVAGERPRRGRGREDLARARGARPARRAARRRRGRAAGAFALQARGHRGRRRPAADAAGARDQDARRDHACSTPPA